MPERFVVFDPIHERVGIGHGAHFETLVFEELFSRKLFKDERGLSTGLPSGSVCRNGGEDGGAHDGLE